MTPSKCSYRVLEFLKLDRSEFSEAFVLLGGHKLLSEDLIWRGHCVAGLRDDRYGNLVGISESLLLGHRKDRKRPNMARFGRGLAVL